MLPLATVTVVAIVAACNFFMRVDVPNDPADDIPDDVGVSIPDDLYNYPPTRLRGLNYLS